MGHGRAGCTAARPLPTSDSVRRLVGICLVAGAVGCTTQPFVPSNEQRTLFNDVVRQAEAAGATDEWSETAPLDRGGGRGRTATCVADSSPDGRPYYRGRGRPGSRGYESGRRGPCRGETIVEARGQPAVCEGAPRSLGGRVVGNPDRARDDRGRQRGDRRHPFTQLAHSTVSRRVVAG